MDDGVIVSLPTSNTVAMGLPSNGTVTYIKHKTYSLLLYLYKLGSNSLIKSILGWVGDQRNQITPHSKLSVSYWSNVAEHKIKSNL